MADLKSAIALIGNNEITGAQARLIEAALSDANAAEIPSTDVTNVIDFIDAYLLYNEVSQEVRSALDFLQAQLRSREAE